MEVICFVGERGGGVGKGRLETVEAVSLGLAISSFSVQNRTDRTGRGGAGGGWGRGAGAAGGNVGG